MEAIEACKKEIADLKNKISELRGGDDDDDEEPQPLQKFAQENGCSLPTKAELNMKQQRMLKGHFGKIYAMHWNKNKNNLVSASQDGKLIIWDAFTTNKQNAIPLRSSWVMTCAYSESGAFVACGGLDNLCSIYRVPGQGETAQNKTHAELAQHEGYLSCCRFIGDSEIITSSGDASCILWDIESKSYKAIFEGHGGDAMNVSIWDSANIFVSASCDATAKLWDYREQKTPVKTFPGHESDINSIQFFPDGNAFVTGSDDSSLRLFDVRAYKQVNKYANDKILCGITSVAFSKTGRLLFAGYDDHSCSVWDTMLGSAELVDSLVSHDNRVSCIGVSGSGKALCTGSWDTLLKVWA